MSVTMKTKKPRPLVVELVGAWGAGKSSLVKSLAIRDGSVRAAPPVWALPKRLLAIGGLQVLGTVMSLLRRRPRVPWKETRQLMRLRALYHHLEILRRDDCRVVVVEDGPALILSWLREAAHGSSVTGDPPRWWTNVVKRWAEIVDIVVFLDAPQRVLTERVLARAQANPFKGRPESELSAELERSREAYVHVISDLQAYDGPTMVSFRTDQRSIAEITDELLVTFASERNGR
jgi:shikimate kinase